MYRTLGPACISCCCRRVCIGHYAQHAYHTLLWCVCIGHYAHMMMIGGIVEIIACTLWLNDNGLPNIINYATSFLFGTPLALSSTSHIHARSLAYAWDERMLSISLRCISPAHECAPTCGLPRMAAPLHSLIHPLILLGCGYSIGVAVVWASVGLLVKDEVGVCVCPCVSACVWYVCVVLDAMNVCRLCVAW